MNNPYLKIKAMSLGAEARIIRAQELRFQKRLRRARERAALTSEGEAIRQLGATIESMDIARVGLHSHRTKEVRREARATHLARGFLKGLPYRKMEATCWEQPNWERVRQIAERYADGGVEPQVVRQRFAEWRDAGGEWKLPRVGPRVKKQRVTKGIPAVDVTHLQAPIK